jgi:hypothetical protein
MVLRDQDLDTNIVRWGLHHLLDGGGAGYGHCARLPQTPTTDYAPTPPPPQTLHALLGGPGHCAHHPQPPTTDYAPQTHHALLDSGVEVTIHAVESDEVIAHALQEELAQVAMAEAEGGSADDEQRATVLAQQWFRPEIVHHLPSGG